MRAFSSVVSITGHVALGAAVLLGTAKAARTDPARPHEVPIIFQLPTHTDQEPGLWVPGPVSIAAPDVRLIPVLSMLPQTGAAIHSPLPAFSATGSSVSTSQPTGGSTVLSEEHAEVLTGPLPVYPELLRQAGVQGKVVLEAVVDTTGRVLPPSISVVSATNPGFVAPARQALLATLFRPAMIGGKAVRMRVRIPYEFAIRGGPGRAR